MGFSIIPVGDNVYVDRKMHLQAPVRLTLTASGVVSPLGANARLLNPHQCCLRAYPLNQAMDSLSVTINNNAVSSQPNYYTSAMTQYNVSERVKDREFSKCPTLGAQSQDFEDLFGSNRSQMAMYGDGYGEENTNFPFTIVSQTNDGAGNLVSVIDFVSCEPLFLSPLLWGKGNSSALRGIRNIDIQCNFVGGAANRMIAIDRISSGVDFTVTGWNTQVQFNNFSPPFSYPDNQPKMLVNYITPEITDQASINNRLLVFPMTQIDPFLTDLPPIAAGASSVAVSNQVQMAQIPNRMYIYLRDNNATLQASPFIPDSFLAITNMSINWGDLGTVLSSASQRQLYDLCVENGYVGNFQSWSGEKINKPALSTNGFGTAAQQYSGVGSVVALSPSQLGLNAVQAPGKAQQFSIQVNVTYKNVSSRTITPTMYVVMISSGIFSLYNGQAGVNIGVLTSEMIFNAERQTGQMMLTFNDIQRVYGGDFFDSLKSGLSKVWNFLKPVVKVAAPALTAAFAPEFAPAVGALVSGLGHGGKKMTKSQLKRNMY